ncbi:MAG: DUF4258 domain-containing protein [Chloroflexota bacterium]|nr:DUF4258 domain-containing protein [Chloroflexota bacterium]
MDYIIHANNKDYIVTYHAAKRMFQRFIDEQLVIETLEQGDLIEQSHGTDLYEYAIDIGDKVLILQVTVDEQERTIVSVIDDTVAKDE